MPLCTILLAIIVWGQLGLNAQSDSGLNSSEADDFIRPTQTDSSSERLRLNFLTATGGVNAHRKLSSVYAQGTIKESRQTRNFQLYETQDGKRHLTYSWRHLGREYETVYVFDGLMCWKQEIKPKKKDARPYSGADATHFANQRWLIQPFTLPSLADYVFKYQGEARVAGRPCYLVVGYGKADVASWFYFDQARSLLIRWGGKGQIAGVEEYMDYRATRFQSVDGIQLPSQIDLLAENAAFGQINFSTIVANPDLSELSFLMPRATTPMLRQRAITPN